VKNVGSGQMSLIDLSTAHSEKPHSVVSWFELNRLGRSVDMAVQDYHTGVYMTLNQKTKEPQGTCSKKRLYGQQDQVGVCLPMMHGWA